MGATNDDSISIGLMAKDNTNKQVLGKSNTSFGYYKGEFFLSKKKVKKTTIIGWCYYPSLKTSEWRLYRNGG